MIKFLRVRNLATIEDLEIHLDRGFSILTGETGAGKSIIIDAIRLILGDKGSPDLVRTGRKEALIEAVFDVSRQSIDLDGLPEPEDGELLIQRSITDQGTGKAFVNGVLVPVRRLRELSGRLIDIYGQNDHVFLLHLENHLGYLDDVVDDPGLLRDTARSARDLRRLVQEKRDLAAREKERVQRLDFIDYQVKEIEAARLRPGEDEELLREREILKNAEKIAGLVDKALDVAYLSEDSLIARLARFRSVLGELSVYDAAFGEFPQGLEEASILLRDAADALVRFKDRRAEIPENPETIEERLSVIEKLKRKYGGTIEAVVGHGEALRSERSSLEAGRERLQELESSIRSKFGEYSDFASRLGAERAKAAEKLGRLIEKEIAILGMKKARFEVRLTDVPPSLDDGATIRDQGAQDAEFLLSPNPGEELRPLRQDRLGRGAIADDAGAQVRGQGQGDPQDAGLRRDRLGDRREDGRVHRPEAPPPVRPSPGDLHHPPAPDRLFRRPPLPRRKEGRKGPDLHERPQARPRGADRGDRPPRRGQPADGGLPGSRPGDARRPSRRRMTP